MNREAMFYQKAQQNRVAEIRNLGDAHKAALYIDKACDLAQALGLEDFPVSRIDLPYQQITPEIVAPMWFELERYMSRVHARNIYELDSDVKQSFVVLDDEWRVKAASYVSHIRDIVRKAELTDERLRQSMMNKIDALQREIERSQTRIASAIETWLEVTEAISAGAKNLEPAAKLLGKVTGAFSRLRREEQEKPAQAQIPSPETLGLPDPDDPGVTDESDA